MKKGMCVTLDDGSKIVLVDSVSHNGEKFFAAVPDGDSEELFFYKQTEDGEGLIEITEEENNDVIEALQNHIISTFDINN